MTNAAAVPRAREAASRGDWEEAFRLLKQAETDGLLDLADLPFLGEVAYAAGHLDETIDAWERAHAACVQAGQPVLAAGAAVRVAMHLLFDTALMAPVRGWLARAERLLEGHEQPTPAHAWFAVIRAYERILSGDAADARPWARRAIEVGAQCDPAACAVGRVAEARLLVFEGNVEEGLALLDEAAMAAVGGDLDPMSTGVVYCELVCALQGLAQYDLAEEWTVVMERWSKTSAIGSLHGRCRVHRAEILRLRGSYEEAEKQALLACEELRPYLRREMGWPLGELGRIRLRTGNLERAEEALLDAHRVGWDPQPDLALLHLARGDVPAAVASIREALEHPARVPWKERPPNNDLQRAPLLQAQVEIEIAAGNIAEAGAAADELGRVADRFRSKALIAGARYAGGSVRLAGGATEEAERELSEAVRLWSDIGAPYEAAVARMRLADALLARGNEQRAEMERRAARSTLDAFRASATGSAAIASEGENRFGREGDYWSVSFAGQTVRVRDLKGMRYLARLLASPGREFHALDLAASEAGSPSHIETGVEDGLTIGSLGDAGEILDERAKSAYRRRLSEIEEDIEEARGRGEDERAAQAEAERDFLVRELAQAVGLGGRDRRAASASERARAGVTRAIRQGIARIGEHHPQLRAHLNNAIRTGTYCAYLPDPRAPIAWKS